MKINSLLIKVGINKVKNNHRVSLITEDSRECVNNSVYITEDNKYVLDAVNKGAKTIITETFISLENINVIVISNVKRYLGLLLSIFHRKILSKMEIIGVIGTNGKTTTSTIGYDFFKYIGKESMLIGSNGIFYHDFYMKTNNTTPNLSIIYKYMLNAYYSGIRFVFMEVSSVGIEQLRVFGLVFKCLIFTNFSEDHLDYHHDMNKYLNFKTIPFNSMSKKSHIIVNTDDPNYENFIKYSLAKCYLYGISNGNFKATDIVSSKDGVSFKVFGADYQSNMIGSFNIYNILAIYVLCEIYKINTSLYKRFLKIYKGVNGRMNKYTYDDKMIIIDYAHTEYAVKNVVDNTLYITSNKLYVVIGCGGNREKEKRSKIGRYLDFLNDRVILTTDNPRYENPIDIINDIKEDMRNPTVIINRSDAIKYGLSKLAPGDTLLILGKGSEDYMEIKGVKYNYSDIEILNEWINEQ